MGISVGEVLFPGNKMRTGGGKTLRPLSVTLASSLKMLIVTTFSQSINNYTCLFLYLRNLGEINEIIVQMYELFVGKNTI